MIYKTFEVMQKIVIALSFTVGINQMIFITFGTYIFDLRQKSTIQNYDWF